MFLIDFLLKTALGAAVLYGIILLVGFLGLMAYEYWYFSVPLVMVLILLGIFSYKPPK